MAAKTFFCVDAHTCGNPVRVVAGGGPVLKGENMFERRLHFMKEFDWIRHGLMFEPRGHDMMSGSIIFPPSNPANDMGILFIETSGCLPMCGHGTIGTVTVAIEQGLVTPKNPGELMVEVPAGLIKVEYKMNGKKVSSVKLTNVPSFIAGKDLEIDSPHLGELQFDVAYGGNFYAIIDPQKNFKGLEHYSADELISFSRPLRKLINEKYTFEHPENREIQGVSHIEWTGATLSENADGRNAVFYGDKAIDRSPCGTGTSARMAQLFARGKLKEGDKFLHESIIGSQFLGKVENRTKVGEFDAIVPSIEGWAKITGFNNIFIDDEDDPYAHGFQVM
ncbi:4-hydroxyproline epimerase [Maribellus maritimus]|uniref:4-hydroxyproline epimerase n=1 Tax=Maribellus maritimus TaxID=2870838 RepID=UPI001EEB5896|nr:4-hydroxyproline epimerase [Maribellus maritimus]MCG6187354.1 4-hydroxyproline epimerase [Maribellus maritimus]